MIESKKQATDRIALLSLVVLFICACQALGGQGSLQLNTGWTLKTGDNPDWARLDFDAKDWRPIQVGVPWEKAGYTDYDGYAWYRLAFKLPTDWKQQALHGFLSLSLGPIDDVDVTFFNGERIGATGGMPPAYGTAYFAKRNYRVPTHLARWGKTNVIALRVYDGEGEGGLNGGPIDLRIPQGRDLFEINYKLSRSNGVYSSPDGLPVTLGVKNHTHADCDLNVVIELRDDRVESPRVLERINTSVHIEGQGEATRAIKFAPPPPGFYRVVCTLNRGMEESMVFGYRPETIETDLTRPSDFAEFWQQRKHALAHVSPAYQVTRSDRSTDEVDVYLVEMRSYGNVRIKGWYTVPQKPGPHPAILSVPGYTSTMWPNLNRPNVATFALNPRGHGNSKDDIDPKGAEYMFLGFDPAHPEKYIYAGAYMDCLRAVDFLVSRPEIDETRIGVEGGSQGGGLSFATAALDPRIAFCASDIPWLGDWIGYLKTDKWPHENYPKLCKTRPGLTFDDINRLLSYFDTMNMAEWITCPVLMSVGLQDDVCPPRTSFATYNAVTSPKEYRVYPFAGHGVWRDHGKLKDAWMAKRLGVEATGL